MRLIRLAMIACTAAVALSGLWMVPVLEAQTPGTPGAAKDKAKAGAPSASAAEPSAEVKAVTQAILDEIDKNSQLMANIEYLCDMIGPRLTGSAGLTRANHWTRDKFTQYGLANVAP